MTPRPRPGSSEGTVRGDAAGLPKQEAGIRNTNLAGDMQALLAERAAVSWGERLRRFLGAQLALWIPLCNLYVTCMLPVYLCFAVERSLALDAIDVASELFAVLELGLQRSRRLRVALRARFSQPQLKKTYTPKWTPVYAPRP